MAEQKLNEKISEDIKEYVHLRMDDTKLAIVEGLSAFTGSTIAFVIMLMLLNVAIFLFTGVFVYLLYLLINSWAWSATIIGVVYVIIGVIVFNKPTCFRNRMVRLFSPLFFCKHKIEEEADHE